MKLKLILSLAVLVLPLFCANAQTDWREVRSGNRKYAGEKWKEAELEYRKARLKDSLSIAASYNLASSLYRQQDIESAAKALDALKGHVEESPHAADWYYNSNT
ncbi:MAG: aerotolerance regulator BatC, partial [Bacteroidales bacterium]|nr:aerotolerance regulator BatC [Bacteroidales bacterium]